MKQNRILVAFGVLILLAILVHLLANASEDGEKKAIVIDAGHGGDRNRFYYYDGTSFNGTKIDLIPIDSQLSGIHKTYFIDKKNVDYAYNRSNWIYQGDLGAAPKFNGTYYFEKDVNLNISIRLAELLEDDFNVILTREDDRYVFLEKRRDISNENNASLFISVHQNSFAGNCSHLNRTIVFYNNNKLKDLANKILKEIMIAAGSAEGNVEQTKEYLVLNNSRDSFLIEVNYICNEHVAKTLVDKDLQERVAASVSKEVKDYFNKNRAKKADIKTKNILEDSTILAFYGRSFSFNQSNVKGARSIASLGSLGFYSNLNDFISGDMIHDLDIHSSEIQHFKEAIKQLDKVNGKKKVTPALDLVVYSFYKEKNMNKIVYKKNHLDNTLKANGKKDITTEVILPSLDKGLLVFIEHQLGNQNVRESMAEIINEGYLQYENVHIAFDPEWKLSHDELQLDRYRIGHVDANDINEALILLADYMKRENVEREILVMIHEFRDSNTDPGERPMIVNKSAIVNPSPDKIKIVYDFDGVGDACMKIERYNLIHQKEAKHGTGIKIFPNFNPFTEKSDFKPVLSYSQIFGKETIENCPQINITIFPDIVVRS